MIWSAIVFYRSGRRSSNGYSLHTLMFLQRKGQMVSCYSRSKVDLALYSLYSAFNQLTFFIELVKINHYKAPRDKLICILNCCKVIFGLLFSVSCYICHITAEKIYRSNTTLEFGGECRHLCPYINICCY
jgi:hypothetical protein